MCVRSLTISSIQLENIFEIIGLMEAFLDLKGVSSVLRCVSLLRIPVLLNMAKISFIFSMRITICTQTVYTPESIVACGWPEQRHH